MISNDLAKKINLAFQSRYPLIYIAGKEEDRIQSTLSSIANTLYDGKQALVSWSAFQGFSDTGECKDPIEALQRISTSDAPTMYLLKDFPAEFKNPKVIRAIRDLYYSLKNKNTFVFFSYPTITLPEMLNNEVYLIETSLPTEVEINAFLQKLLAQAGLNDQFSAELVQQYSIAMMGLTLSGVEHLMTRLTRSEKHDFEQFLPDVIQEKAQLLKKESCLQFVPLQQSLEQIGGLDNLKDWVLQRKHLFTQEAFDAGMPLPSGILFMGVSGCGKSMAAKAIAKAWNIPLVRLDMSLVLSGAYGPPETAFAHATSIADQIAPIVLWIDELENSFGYDEHAPGQGNINIFSSFLTWMQEKSPKIFLAATANRIKQLPAELMRKGRFDELFFLNLPTKPEREQILTIHILLHGGDPEGFDMSYLSAVTKDWSGAEIEQAVKSARIEAHRENRAFTEKDIGHTAAGMIPLAHTMKEQIKEIKDWSINRAVPASKEE